MTFKTLEGVLRPDGKVTLGGAPMPGHSVRVLITILAAEEESVLAEPGDFLEQLQDYEARLAGGEIKWQ